jgi:hypothetical protein
MCLTEIWTYSECGCQYLYPVPCYDRILPSPGKSETQDHLPYQPSLSRRPSPVACPSAAREDPMSDAVSQPPSKHSRPRHEDEDAAYAHALSLVRACSLRRRAQKTFLEPICDGCLLAELGLAPEVGAILGGGRARRDEWEHEIKDRDEDEGLDGAEWLLESKVEIVVEGPDDDGTGEEEECESRSGMDRERTGNRATANSSDSDGSIIDSENWTRSRGRTRTRRKAMDISREPLFVTQTSPLKNRTSFQRLKQTGQHLRRARKQPDLRSGLLRSTDLLGQGTKTKPMPRPSSWIEHLKSDLGQRTRRRKRICVKQKASESATDDSSTAEDDRILSLPSIPATAYSAFSSLSESIMVPLDQIMSSSEFDSSQVVSSGNWAAVESAPQADDKALQRNSASSSRSTKSFHTASSSIPQSSSPAAGLTYVVPNAVGEISMHPLSCPLLAQAAAEDDSVEVKVQSDEESEDAPRG